MILAEATPPATKHNPTRQERLVHTVKYEGNEAMDWVGMLFEEQLVVFLVEHDLRVLVAGETPSRVSEVSSYCTFIKFPSLLIVTEIKLRKYGRTPAQKHEQ
jgi:hypothetical protein